MEISVPIMVFIRYDISVPIMVFIMYDIIVFFLTDRYTFRV